LSYAATFGGIVYAVAIWTHPVSRLLPQGDWLELRRLAAAPDAPRNTCSRMLAVMARLIHRQQPHIARLISYQDTDVHTGGIYRASGWSPVDTSASQTKWNSTGRRRPAEQSLAAKVRWEKRLAEEVP
jgi:hypothetical protein